MEAEPIKIAGAPPVQGGQQRKVEPPQTGPAPSPKKADVPGDTVTLSRQGQQTLDAASGNNVENTQWRLDVADNAQVVLKIVDPRTGETVKQIPPEEQVKLNQAIQSTVDDLSNQNKPV